MYKTFILDSNEADKFTKHKRGLFFDSPCIIILYSNHGIIYSNNAKLYVQYISFSLTDLWSSLNLHFSVVLKMEIWNWQTILSKQLTWILMQQTQKLILETWIVWYLTLTLFIWYLVVDSWYCIHGTGHRILASCFTSLHKVWMLNARWILFSLNLHL